MSNSCIDRIISHKACIGCGLCEAIDTRGCCTMQIGENGFYKPIGCLDNSASKIINKICPGKNVKITKYGGLWGVVNEIYDGWANDANVRQQASSGGVISAICINLINSGIVTAVLHVGNDESNPKYNKLCISRTKDDILKRCSSRYAPADVFSKINDYLNLNEKYAFVGKPCDITALKSYLDVHPQYKSKIKLFLSFFCAGIPSYIGTDKLLDLNKKLIYLKYRGNGWPGFFTAKYEDGTKFKLSYTDSWGAF